MRGRVGVYHCKILLKKETWMVWSCKTYDNWLSTKKDIEDENKKYKGTDWKMNRMVGPSGRRFESRKNRGGNSKLWKKVGR